MIEDAPCGDLKGYISRCRFLVAARTHASIAAYSTGVPALVAGYSVKARGLPATCSERRRGTWSRCSRWTARMSCGTPLFG